MKKTYVAPTIEVVPLKTRSQILVASIVTNVDLQYEGATPYDFDSDDIH